MMFLLVGFLILIFLVYLVSSTSSFLFLQEGATGDEVAGLPTLVTVFFSWDLLRKSFLLTSAHTS